MEDLPQGWWTSSLSQAKRMRDRPGDNTSNTFTLASHVDRNLTAEESAEEILAYFVRISQEFTPIEENILQELVIEKLENGPFDHLEIVEHGICENMKKARKTDSVPGYKATEVLQEFLPELATQIAAILKEAVASHTWPAGQPCGRKSSIYRSRRFPVPSQKTT